MQSPGRSSGTTDRPPIAGVVLAGGLSRRMGGGDKGLLEIAGRSMLGRVIDRLRPQVDCLVINANGATDRFAAFGLPVVADAIDGFVGPLGGVLAGMRWASRCAPQAALIVTVSSDAPFIPANLVEALRLGVADRPTAIAIARSAGEPHPVIGLWPVALADDLERALLAGVRKVLQWTDRHGTVPVDFPMIACGAERIDPFFNANTPGELAEARRLTDLSRIA